jgi:EAL domain-containing protein (putative c-di-GMP-specific phosphodiesterase class I)
MKNKIKRKYRGLFNKKHEIDREIIKLVNKNELDVVITDVETGTVIDRINPD